MNDECITASESRSELKTRYPDARTSLLRNGGDFPFICFPAEITLHLEVHLRRCGLFPMREELIQQQSEDAQELAAADAHVRR